ncbi:MAG: hypothetical protein HY675_23400 [Chloroflexi bacterium]|nr:hypothetical protein [Chloroflexota bacterium]
MPRSYSQDLRERVLADIDEGAGATAVGRRYRVNRATVESLRRTPAAGRPR